jgi:hypothetical protein
LSVVVTVRSGFDLEYYIANAARGPEHSPGGYYITAGVQGEAPGRWFGHGCQDLGLTGHVSAEQFRQVYSLADPTTGKHLGGPRRDFTRSYEARLAQLRTAEPHATADRVHQLEHQARQDTRQSPAYTDVTLNYSKSISLLHGSIRENAARARDTGDLAAAAWWDERDARLCDILQQANTAGMEHLQTWAGVTRTGYHGRMVSRRELGKWEPAELVGTSWLQATSRDGEMHDHIHNPVLPRVCTLSDGKWRATDTMAIRRQIPAIQATAAAYVEAALSREFGVEWIPRPDGMGNEIRGVTADEIDAFSSRRNSVTAKQAELAEQFRRKYGRAPNQRELLSIHRTAWAITREAKPVEPIDFDAAAREWGAEWARKFGTPLAALASRVSNMRGPGYAPSPAPEPPRQDARSLAVAARVALARVQSKNATWTRADLMRQIKVSLPAAEFGLDPEAAVRLVNDLTDRTLGASSSRSSAWRLPSSWRCRIRSAVPSTDARSTPGPVPSGTRPGSSSRSKSASSPPPSTRPRRG